MSGCSTNPILYKALYGSAANNRGFALATTTRERTTMLQIIAALAAEADLDLEKHSKAAETLQAIGAKHGLELPKKSDTIAGKLKEARELQKTR